MRSNRLGASAAPGDALGGRGSASFGSAFSFTLKV